MIESTYDFVTPSQIIFGWRRRGEIARFVAPLGSRAFVVCGSRTLERRGEISRLVDIMTREGVVTQDVHIQTSEPTVHDVDCLTEKYLRLGALRADSVVIGIGGGAAMDLAKATAAMVTNFEKDSSVKDYLEGVGCGRTLEIDPLPIVLLPTTAGSGAEATRNAVISNAVPRFKKSLRDTRLFAKVVIVDPELTVTNPPELTACSGLDAITQLFESFISRKARPIPQALALQGLRLAFHSIERAFHDPTNREAREKMSHAALLSGLCLANSGLGMAHGIAPALGTHGLIAHGKACAMLLPKALRTNADVCRERLAYLALNLFPNSYFPNEEEAIETLLYEVNALLNVLQIPRRLSEAGIREDQLPAIVADSRGSSMSGNPKNLSNEEILHVLKDLL
ncbi:MAG: iron-containing alcohol dehydrogenase [Planctomycetia bacterium]|nr:iron-containing alcohol dehydrogenase [Planctomycetia bacterium]